ncbi:hypothetical protein [Halococcus salsus]|uniref:hypothetical protein n=1 Tax=Halococcus salsus TaxID=2162894 RepID=UPI00135A370E|nr:hypothetical protein [Halococcus salsus]
MQRRAAAIYVVFFVVVAIAAYSLTTVAEKPSVSVEGESYSQGDPINASGTQWTVNVADGSGNVSSTNDSARFTTSFSNNTSLAFQNGMYRPAPNGSGEGAGTASTGTTSGAGTTGTSTSGPSTGATTSGGATNGASSSTPGTEFRVVIPNESAGNASGGNASAANVSSFTLRQEFDTAARLRADPAVADTTLSGANDTEYVRYRNGTTQPLDAYLPEPTTRNVSVGDRFPYQNNSSRVESINTSGVTLAWRANLTRSQELAAGENVTLGGTTYVAQFPQNDSVVLSQNVSGYQAEQEALDHFNDRMLGLWGVVIISLFAAILVLALAYLPVRG